MKVSALRASSFVVLVVASVCVSVSACSSSSDDKGPGSGTGEAGADTSTNDASADTSTNDAGGGDGCNKLCVDAKFSSGKATQFGMDVLECQCSGTSSVGGITKPACETYCAPKVAPAKAFLSSEVSPNDKCVCDGT